MGIQLDRESLVKLEEDLLTKNDMNAKKMKELEIMKSQQPSMYHQMILEHAKQLQSSQNIKHSKSPFSEQKSFSNFSASKNEEKSFKMPPPLMQMKQKTNENQSPSVSLSLLNSSKKAAFAEKVIQNT